MAVRTEAMVLLGRLVAEIAVRIPLRAILTTTRLEYNKRHSAHPRFLPGSRRPAKLHSRLRLVRTLTDRWPDMMKLIDAGPDYAKAPKNINM